MKRLFLLRHATAPRQKSESDKDRRLNEVGALESKAIGKYMKDKRYLPEFTISSDSPRTVETFKLLNDVLNIQEAIYTDELYNVSSHQLLEAIEHTSDELNSLMLVSHNPSITSVLDLLNASCERESLIKSRDYTIAGKLVVIDSDCVKWSEISKSNNRIADVYFPTIMALDKHD